MEEARNDPLRVSSLLEGRPQSNEPHSSGNPLALDITDRERAARINGVTLASRTLDAGRFVDERYRVDFYRRFLPRRGSAGIGLLQFWGQRATRVFPAGEEPSEWQYGREGALHTVEITAELTVAKKKRRKR